MVMTTRRFATPVFRGGRFESQMLPVDVLPDLAAYRDLVVELAKHLFLQRNPQRKRVPKGFVESFQLAIRAIEAGSAGAVLELLPAAMPPGLLQADLFDEARDRIEAAIEAASKRRTLPRDFPAHLAKRFNQLGRGLRDDEYLELRSAERTSGPRYDKSVRKWIVVQYEGRYEDEVDLLVTMSGGVIDREQLTVRTERGRLIDGSCPQQLVRQALQWADRRVRLIGVGSFDRHDELERLIKIDEILLVDEDEDEMGAPSSLAAQFEDLAKLRDGWFEPDTAALDPAGLKAFHRFLEQAVREHGIPRPFLYPTPDGEARAEWSFPDWEVSATIQIRGRLLHLHATHLKSDDSEEAELSLESEGAVSSFAKFVLQFAHKLECDSWRVQQPGAGGI
jgi:hypothetical protein